MNVSSPHSQQAEYSTSAVLRYSKAKYIFQAFSLAVLFDLYDQPLSCAYYRRTKRDPPCALASFTFPNPQAHPFLSSIFSASARKSLQKLGVRRRYINLRFEDFAFHAINLFENKHAYRILLCDPRPPANGALTALHDDSLRECGWLPLSAGGDCR